MQTTFDDDFCVPSSGWPSGDTATERYGYLIGMSCEYRIQLKTAPRNLRVTPKVSARGDFAVTASGYPLGSGAFGIVFGLTDARDHFFLFAIDTERRYALYRYDAGTWSALLPWTTSALVDPDFGNTLRVESTNDGIGLYLDGALLNGMSDGLTHEGQVGLYAESTVAGFDARFTRFRVEAVP
jgi:hypothetical protein